MLGTPARTSSLTTSVRPSASPRSSWLPTAGTTQPTAHQAGSSPRSTPSRPRARGVTLTGIESVQLDKQALKLATERGLAAAARGELTPVIGQTYPLERAAEAHAAIEARTVFGKTLLTM